MAKNNAVVHDFAERLEWSASLSDEAALIEFYRKLWPDMIACVRIDANCKWQRVGVDREIILPGLKHIYIDEKKRDSEYTDVLLEEWSVSGFDWNSRQVIKPQKIGWALDGDKQCDYVAYAIPKNGLCYLLPFEILRATCVSNLPIWKRNTRWYPKPAKNDTYVTINIAVPWPELQRCMVNEMRRAYTSSLSLPVPEFVGNQLLFPWNDNTT